MRKMLKWIEQNLQQMGGKLKICHIVSKLFLRTCTHSRRGNDGQIFGIKNKTHVTKQENVKTSRRASVTVSVVCAPDITLSCILHVPEFHVNQCFKGPLKP
ncbi:hypothetical protein H5410_014363 [Solanum commersonii]|uniref:Uncharacterized protein n=1 Tax=Solanum commersonii TaxID=4109 RepID=A0A9J5ZR13_SOLCO|nr:hypothetical protein H5410_014363 [Solanum commersonii]